MYTCVFICRFYKGKQIWFLFWRRCNVANLDIIPTPFCHRDAGGIEVRGYTCVFICRFYRGKRFLTSYFPPWMTRQFKKGSTLKGKNPRWVMIFSLRTDSPWKGWWKRKWKWHPYSVPIQIKNSSMRPCDAKEMRLLRHQHYTFIEYGQSITDYLES